MDDFKCALCGVHAIEGNPDDPDVDPLCAPCRIEVEAASQTIHDPVEIILAHHLPVTVNDRFVMCLCHADASNAEAIFRGPALHRRHVAELIREALGLEPPAPWTPVVEP